MSEQEILRVSELFVRLQSLRDLAWRSHINRKPAAALEYAQELAQAALELRAILERKA